MRVINDHRISELSLRFIPMEILDFDPIIAGGFAVWVYKTLEYIDKNDIDWENFLLQLDRALDIRSNVADVRFAVSDNSGSNHTINITFKDIDLWFERTPREGPNNDTKLSPSNSIRTIPYPIGQNIFKTAKWFRTVYDKVSNITAAGRNYMQEPFESAGIKSRFEKSTDWANSYTLKLRPRRSGFARVVSWAQDMFNMDASRQTYDVSIQFIKKPIEKMEDLFKSFDIDNCAMAVQYGRLYISEPAEAAFISAKININEEKVLETFIERMHRTLRVFKYAKRYDLELAPALSEDIFNLYLEILEHPLTEKFKTGEAPPFGGGAFHNLFAGLTFEEKDDDYIFLYDEGEHHNPPPQKLERYIRDMINSFSVFTGLKGFEPFWASYFIDTKIPRIDRAIQEVLYPDDSKDIPVSKTTDLDDAFSLW